MDIVRILNLSENEVNTLMQSGKILKEIEESFTSSTSDALNPENKELLKALNEVLNSVLNFEKVHEDKKEF